jgi:hypothetical protein
MTTFGESYKEMSHRGTEGRFLDIRDASERFELYFEQIEFIDGNTKRRLLGLVQNTVKRYGLLNPYAYAIGFVAVVSDPRTSIMSITKESLARAYKYLTGYNHYDILLSDLIDKPDIIRYARMYIRIQTVANDEGKNNGLDDIIEEDVEEGYEDEDDYGDENFGDGDYGGYEDEDD